MENPNGFAGGMWRLSHWLRNGIIGFGGLLSLGCANRAHELGACAAGDAQAGKGCVVARLEPATCEAGAPCDASAGDVGSEAGACEPPRADSCSGVCVDLAGDPDHCGDCETRCPSDQFCVAGQCAAACSGMTPLQCGDRCVDPRTDREHCGGCDNTCGTDEQCSGARCASTCGADTPYTCGALCVDLQSDTQHCGECGHACDAGQVCAEGSCAAECGGSKSKECARGCVNLLTDPRFCGDCETACAEGEVCSDGVCSSGCTSVATSICAGLCVETPWEPDACGACGVKCAPGAVCSYGQCAPSCHGTGRDQCGDRCVDLANQPQHCGQCNNACTPGSVCSEGKCTQACGGATPFLCGTRCLSEVEGVACGQCLPGMHLCAMGCVDWASDVEHCGECDKRCSASESCSEGRCVLLAERDAGMSSEPSDASLVDGDISATSPVPVVATAQAVATVPAIHTAPEATTASHTGSSSALPFDASAPPAAVNSGQPEPCAPGDSGCDAGLVCPVGFMDVQGVCLVGLGAFELSEGELSPAFETDVFSYTVQLPVLTRQLSLLLLSEQGTVTVNDEPVAADGLWTSPTLNLGINSFEVKVSEAGSVGVVYTLNVVRDDSIVYLKASNAQSGAQFGDCVAISTDGNTLAVAAPFDPGITGFHGGVYIFRRTDQTWTEDEYLRSDNPCPESTFGASIALSADGGTVAVGTINDCGHTEIGEASVGGTVYLFARVGDTWTEQAYVKSPNLISAEGFGSAVALSSDAETLAVGSPMESDSMGAAYVFAYDGSYWKEEEFDQPLPLGTQLGWSVALSAAGDKLAVGSPYGAWSSQAQQVLPRGAAFVYERTSGVWTQQGSFTASAQGDLFGYSVAFSTDGITLAVGAPGKSGAFINESEGYETPGAGAAYVFTYASGVWASEAELKASNTGANDEFGSSVSLSSDGNTLAVGAPGEDGSATGLNGEQNDLALNTGAAYVFTRSGGDWPQTTYVKSSNTDSAPDYDGGDDFAPLALAGDGATLVVGARSEESAGLGVDGEQFTPFTRSSSGAAYVFRLNAP